MPTSPSTALAPSAADTAWPDGITPTEEFRTALSFVHEGDGNLFVTGRAGTGKSTLLRALRNTTDQELVVVAPTGLAAVNVHVSQFLAPVMSLQKSMKRYNPDRLSTQMLTRLPRQCVRLVASLFRWQLHVTHLARFVRL